LHLVGILFPHITYSKRGDDSVGESFTNVSSRREGKRSQMLLRVRPVRSCAGSWLYEGFI